MASFMNNIMHCLQQSAIAQRLLAISCLLLVLFFAGRMAVIAGNGTVMLLFTALWLALACALFIRARQRRALLVLAHLQHHSRWARWLKGGLLLFLWQLIIGAPMALTLLLVLSQGIGAQGWLLLIITAFLWPLAESLCRHQLNKQFTTAARDYFTGIATLLLLAVLILPVFVLISFWQPLADLSPLSMAESFYYAQDSALGQSDLLHTLAGFWLGADGIRLWFSQSVSAMQYGTLLNVFVWFFSFLQAALFVIPFLLLMQLGSFTAQRFSSANKAPAPVKLVLLLLAALLIPALLLWDQLAEKPWQWLGGQRIAIVIDDQIYDVKPQQLDAVLEQELQKLDEKNQQYFYVLNTQVEQQLDAVFKAARLRVPDYADWHFSALGKVQRAGTTLMANDTGKKVLEKLFPEESLQEKTQRINRFILYRYSQQQSEAAMQLIENLKQAFAADKRHPHRTTQDTAAPLDIRQIYMQHLTETLAGDRAMAQLSGTVASGGAIAVLHWAATRSLASRSASAVAARGAGRAGSRFAPLACVVTGPAALLCGAAVFTLSTVIVESALLYHDEYKNRAALEQQLTDTLSEMQHSLKQQYQRQLLAMLHTDVEGIKARVSGQVKAVDYL